MIEIYTDGAIKQGHIGWGFVARNTKVNKMVYEAFGVVDGEPDLLAQRNVAGETQAVMEAIRWALTMRHKSVNIVSDYKGCIAWADGTWQAKNKYTARYKAYVNHCREKMRIVLLHVKGHSGNVWNDRADMLAKSGARLACENKESKTLKGGRRHVASDTGAQTKRTAHGNRTVKKGASAGVLHGEPGSSPKGKEGFKNSG